MLLPKPNCYCSWYSIETKSLFYWFVVGVVMVIEVVVEVVFLVVVVADVVVNVVVMAMVVACLYISDSSFTSKF